MSIQQNQTLVPGQPGLRVAFLVNSATARGGTQAYLTSLMKALNYSGFRCSMISQDDYANGGEFLRSVSENGADIRCLFSVFEPELLSGLTSLGPAVAWIHDYTAVCPGYAKFLWRSSRVCPIGSGWRCALHIYGDRCAGARAPHSVHRAIRRSLRQKEILKRVERIIVASRFVKEVLLANGFDSRRIDVAPIYPVCPVGSEGVSEERKFILFAGRVDKEKGLSRLLRAVSKADRSLRLEIAGEGTDRLSCQKMAGELGIADRVRFLGWLDQAELDRKMRACRFAVLPSIWPEPYGIVGVEMLARAKPVIAFDVGGLREWLKHEERGMLVEPFVIDEFARCMEALWSEPSRVRRMGEQGREFVEKHLTKKLHLDQLSRVFRNVAP